MITLGGQIEAGKFKPAWIEARRRTKLKMLMWVFTPGHAGVRSKERADHLAEAGLIE